MQPLCRSLLCVFPADTSHPLPYPSPIEGEGFSPSSCAPIKGAWFGSTPGSAIKPEVFSPSAATAAKLPLPSPLVGEGGAGNSRPLGRACVTASRGSEWRVLQGSRESGLRRFPLSQFNHRSGGEMAHSAACAR